MAGQMGATRPVPTPLCLLALGILGLLASWKSDARDLPLGSQWKALLWLVTLCLPKIGLHNLQRKFTHPLGANCLLISICAGPGGLTSLWRGVGQRQGWGLTLDRSHRQQMLRNSRNICPSTGKTARVTAWGRWPDGLVSLAGPSWSQQSPAEPREGKWQKCGNVTGCCQESQRHCLHNAIKSPNCYTRL